MPCDKAEKTVLTFETKVEKLNTVNTKKTPV